MPVIPVSVYEKQILGAIMLDNSLFDEYRKGFYMRSTPTGRMVFSAMADVKANYGHIDIINMVEHLHEMDQYANPSADEESVDVVWLSSSIDGIPHSKEERLALLESWIANTTIVDSDGNWKYLQHE